MKQHAADFRARVNLVLHTSNGQHELAHGRKHSSGACILPGGTHASWPG